MLQLRNTECLKEIYPFIFEKYAMHSAQTSDLSVIEDLLIAIKPANDRDDSTVANSGSFLEISHGDFSLTLSMLALCPN